MPEVPQVPPAEEDRGEPRLEVELRRHHHFVTILVADIAGSTQFYERYGDIAGLAMVQRCMDLVYPVIAANFGTVVKTVGDSVMARFDRPEAAACAAVEIQSQLAAANATACQAEQIHLRIGIHSGFALISGDDIFGDVVNVAARVGAIADRDEIIVSADVRDEIGSVAGLPAMKEFRNVELKGKSAPVSVYALLWQESGRRVRLRTLSAPNPRELLQAIWKFLTRERHLGGKAEIASHALRFALGGVLGLLLLSVSRPWPEPLFPALQTAVPLTRANGNASAPPSVVTSDVVPGVAAAREMNPSAVKPGTEPAGQGISAVPKRRSSRAGVTHTVAHPNHEDWSGLKAAGPAPSGTTSGTNQAEIEPVAANGSAAANSAAPLGADFTVTSLPSTVVTLHVIHHHLFGKSTGDLRIGPKGVVFESDSPNDSFAAPADDIAAYSVTAHDGRLQIELKYLGREFNFTDNFADDVAQYAATHPVSKSPSPSPAPAGAEHPPAF
jgi:class 3 adenylate cyclase